MEYPKLQRAYHEKGYKFFDGVNNVNLFGIRSEEMLVDEFNDVLGIAYQDYYERPIVLMWPGTTKPGLYWLKKKLGNVDGTAILIPGQYRGVWKIGTHGGTAAQYEALRQVGTNFKVWRDDDKDGHLDMHGKEWDNVTGLNFHTTSFLNDKEVVGAYSAGCQVVQDDKDFLMAMALLKRSSEIYGNSFTYTLFTDRDFL